MVERLYAYLISMVSTLKVLHFTQVTRVHLKCQASNRFGHLSFECEDT